LVSVLTYLDTYPLTALGPTWGRYTVPQISSRQSNDPRKNTKEHNLFAVYTHLEPKRPGVKLLLKGCGTPTHSAAEIQIPVSRKVAIACIKLFFVIF